MDRMSPQARSRVMSSIGTRGTSPELELRRALRAAGARLAVFVDGCFWHSCPSCGRLPSSRLRYWIPKLAANLRRDRRDGDRLRRAGWSVMRIREHDIAADPGRCAGRILRRLHSRARQPVSSHR